MNTLVFLLEEASVKAMLEGLLPKIIPESIDPKFIVFEGKQDLEKQIERKLRGWLKPNSAFIVLRDQDSGDCIEIKDALVGKCNAAQKPNTIVRIACRELESWYFGDLAAVEKGLGLSNLSRFQRNQKYRNPDEIVRPSDELEKITKGKYQKVSGSRAIGPNLSIDGNNSKSFCAFLQGIEKAKSLLNLDIKN